MTKYNYNEDEITDETKNQLILYYNENIYEFNKYIQKYVKILEKKYKCRFEVDYGKLYCKTVFIIQQYDEEEFRIMVFICLKNNGVLKFDEQKINIIENKIYTIKQYEKYVFKIIPKNTLLYIIIRSH